jgi:protease I
MKLFIISLLLLTNTTFASEPKKVLMIINEGFQVDEYFVPRKSFENQKYKIVTASRYGGIVNPGRKYTSQYKPVSTDLNFEQVKIEDYDAITFVGGAGAWTDYFPNKTLHQILLNAIKNKKMIVGLICAGTGVLATANNLDGLTPQFKGRHVTGYGEVSGLLKLQGQVNYESGDLTKAHVVEDENLITGRDPISSQLFADTIIKKLNTL